MTRVGSSISKTARVRVLAGLLLLAVASASGQEGTPWTLEQALACVRTNSPDARLANFRIASARAGIQQAEATYWPRLQFQSSYTRTDNPMQVFGSVLNQRAYSPSLDFNDVPDADNLNVRGWLTVPLYAGGRNTAGLESARAQTEAARQQGEAVMRALEFEVVRAFFTVVKTRAFTEAAEAAVQSFASNLTIASNRFHAGTALKTEVLDLEVRLSQSREDLSRTRHAQILARHVLRNILGLESAGEIDIPQTSEAETSLLALPEDDVDPVRLELTALWERARAAEAEVRRARGGYKPRLDAFGSLDYDRGWEFDGDGSSYTAGVLLHWDIWDGQLTRGKVNAARTELDTVLEEARKMKLAIDLEIEQARLRYEEATERLATTHRSVDQAQESVLLTRSRFEEGLALASQLIDAETALTSARVRRAEAMADRQIAIGAWRHALGLRQQSHSIEP